ncbi:beta-lactamase class A [Saccharopolyspora antimicrobica]|uniref:Beta-lactamase n=1 Tax=Saccharopolyspora antimicrobica TaxID=455193 RepID=A0A1I5KCS6_9PSEU|nr:class A beta-lactamase [Saccharopolyspora antimicrobica]RKT81954.1 beta-lactamase class A [Saccharopolyspora antimicrobica]SFO82882.1 beta-lactamase class A [Saccharopolyspora antimicrobica]
MRHNEIRLGRRAVLGALLAVPALVACGTVEGAPPPAPAPPGPDLAELERRYDARVGLYAINVRTGRTLVNRPDERFALCSTFKTYAVAALLRDHGLSSGYFDKVIRYTKDDLVSYSPETEKHVDTGMTVRALCEATMKLSDNTAANLLLRERGGPQSIAPFARSIGDPTTRLDRWETELNTAIPGDERDTSTPAGLAAGYRALVLGDALAAPERDQLTEWLLANTTGDECIRAGVPPTWRTGEKTGAGDYGTRNDAGVTWTEDGTPIVIAILTTRPRQDDEYRNELLADTARAVAAHLR